MIQLTPRWKRLDHHAEQWRLWNSKARFRVVPAGRRSGKTEIAKRFIVMAAMRFRGAPDGLFVAAAPTRAQAKSIYWEDLKRMVPKWAQAKTPSETELCIYLLHGVELRVVGMDRPERIEGKPIDGIVLDEYANMKPRAWTDNVRPALSTPGRYGWAWLIGVPEGRNHYYEVFMDARRSRVENPNSDWDTFAWPSSDILDPAEVEAARHDLDPRTFRQEYEGSFENFAGAAYYGFEREIHAAEKLTRYYDETKPLITCYDFNVSPGVAAIGQDLMYTGHNPKVDREKPVTMWLGEVWIPDNSNSERVARRVAQDWSVHEGPVWLEGDSTGGARGTAKVSGSDWDLIKRVLKEAFPGRVVDHVQRKNPAERARLNAMNSRMMSHDGTVRMLVDPVACPRLVADFEGVTLIEGTGELDKKSSPMLTHISDGAGYFVARAHPCRSGPSVGWVPVG